MKKFNIHVVELKIRRGDSLSKGIYILLVKLINDTIINVGKLGNIPFKAGYYLYVGSGQTNVEKRVSRYFKKIKKPRWHIDYLLNSGKAIAEKALILNLSKKYECKISQFIESIGAEHIVRFGCSDCDCKSHLFYVYTNPEKVLMHVVGVFNHELTEIYSNRNW